MRPFLAGVAVILALGLAIYGLDLDAPRIIAPAVVISLLTAIWYRFAPSEGGQRSAQVLSATKAYVNR